MIEQEEPTVSLTLPLSAFVDIIEHMADCCRDCIDFNDETFDAVVKSGALDQLPKSVEEYIPQSWHAKQAAYHRNNFMSLSQRFKRWS